LALIHEGQTIKKIFTLRQALKPGNLEARVCRSGGGRWASFEKYTDSFLKTWSMVGSDCGFFRHTDASDKISFNHVTFQ
jgi:hypothetical protein